MPRGKSKQTQQALQGFVAPPGSEAHKKFIEYATRQQGACTTILKLLPAPDALLERYRRLRIDQAAARQKTRASILCIGPPQRDSSTNQRKAIPLQDTDIWDFGYKVHLVKRIKLEARFPSPEEKAEVPLDHDDQAPEELDPQSLQERDQRLFQYLQQQCQQLFGSASNQQHQQQLFQDPNGEQLIKGFMEYAQRQNWFQNPNGEQLFLHPNEQQLLFQDLNPQQKPVQDHSQQHVFQTPNIQPSGNSYPQSSGKGFPQPSGDSYPLNQQVTIRANKWEQMLKDYATSLKQTRGTTSTSGGGRSATVGRQQQQEDMFVNRKDWQQMLARWSIVPNKGRGGVGSRKVGEHNRRIQKPTKPKRKVAAPSQQATQVEEELFHMPTKEEIEHHERLKRLCEIAARYRAYQPAVEILDRDYRHHVGGFRKFVQLSICQILRQLGLSPQEVVPYAPQAAHAKIFSQFYTKRLMNASCWAHKWVDTLSRWTWGGMAWDLPFLLGWSPSVLDKAYCANSILTGAYITRYLASRTPPEPWYSEPRAFYMPFLLYEIFEKLLPVCYIERILGYLNQGNCDCRVCSYDDRTWRTTTNTNLNNDFNVKCTSSTVHQTNGVRFNNASVYHTGGSDFVGGDPCAGYGNASLPDPAFGTFSGNMDLDLADDDQDISSDDLTAFLDKLCDQNHVSSPSTDQMYSFTLGIRSEAVLHKLSNQLVEAVKLSRQWQEEEAMGRKRTACLSVSALHGRDDMTLSFRIGVDPGSRLLRGSKMRVFSSTA